MKSAYCNRKQEVIHIFLPHENDISRVDMYRYYFWVDLDGANSQSGNRDVRDGEARLIVR